MSTAAGNSGDGSLVWTAKSKARMIAAKNTYQALKNNPNATLAQKKADMAALPARAAGITTNFDMELMRFAVPHSGCSI